ncbi:hypothetical protein EIN_087870 [Entamoeba invadens IP1]|uniref:hypothetical protein n=1 Tax=Entamoeba invadens IP1 TaxID=370355 RepID=UPI0002C3DB48|nr:hypothetical protein EIN_087870 [Entamoeba invadens IP1]ELP85455.1 hypothetical protein EIN_087870 [Entamoeba invadens IP1]|eukprot:XP_004184801.1 hypothetical protein EIN_087870 [Entamoeba invadens IP1]
MLLGRFCNIDITSGASFNVSKLTQILSGSVVTLHDSLQLFGIKTGTLEFSGWMIVDGVFSIQADNISFSSSTIFQVMNRAPRDVAIFSIKSHISFPQNFSFWPGFNTFDFDFAFSEEEMTIEHIPSGFTLLQNGRLLRYGSTSIIYCHLIAPNIYLEPYCPFNGCYLANISQYL